MLHRPRVTVPGGRHGGVVGELELAAVIGLGQDTCVAGFLDSEQSPVGVADDEGSVARVDLQAERAAVGVGEQFGVA